MSNFARPTRNDRIYRSDDYCDGDSNISNSHLNVQGHHEDILGFYMVERFYEKPTKEDLQLATQSMVRKLSGH
jgi:hypothetical protein